MVDLGKAAWWATVCVRAGLLRPYQPDPRNATGKVLKRQLTAEVGA